MFDQKQYYKEYRERNREKLLQQKREYYYANRERILENFREKYAAQPETIKQRNRVYARNNRETIAVRSSEYQKGKGKIRRWQRMADPEHRASRILLSSKKTAKRKNIPFSLQPSDIVDALRRGVCEATGMPLSMTTLDRNDPWRPSIDRIIPSNGYVPGNVRIVVWMYNAAKQQYCDSDVIAMARAIVGKHGLSEERVA